MGVSVVLAVKNEENSLKRCLESVRWADEIVIVDNGSTDNTISIANRYTDRIYEYGKNALIPRIQQFGIEKAAEDWILVLDADVVVPKKTKEEIQSKINDKGYNAYYIDHPIYFLGRFTRSRCWRFPTVKLFRRGKGFYCAERPHCAVRITGKTGHLDGPLLHYSNPSISSFLKKMDLYTTQDAILLSKGKKAGLLNKKIRKVGVYSLFVEPMLLFFYYYVYGLGFMDGFRGIILASLFSYYLFIERIKLWEIINKA